MLTSIDYMLLYERLYYYITPTLNSATIPDFNNFFLISEIY